MNSSRHFRRSDRSALAAQRGAAMAKSIAGLAVLAGGFAVAMLARSDIQFAPAIEAGERAVAVRAPAASFGAEMSAPGADLDAQLRLDPREISDYRSNVHG